MALSPNRRISTRYRIALLDRREHFEPANDAVEDGVQIIQPLLRAEHEAVLRTVAVGSGVRHLEGACRAMAKPGHQLDRETVTGPTVASRRGISPWMTNAAITQWQLRFSKKGFRGRGPRVPSIRPM